MVLCDYYDYLDSCAVVRTSTWYSIEEAFVADSTICDKSRRLLQMVDIAYKPKMKSAKVK